MITLTERPTFAQQSVRLNKYLSLAGISSRRKADELIREGKVVVNRTRVSTPGLKIDPHRDKVFVAGKQILPVDDKVYIVLHKPKDCITTVNDEKRRRTVMDLVRVRERVYPVGRLDRNTTGVLLLTNDGDLAHRMMHPRYEMERVYAVELDRSLSPEALGKLRYGMRIEGERVIPNWVQVIPNSSRKQIQIALHEGKNRQVHRMFEACGYTVEKLHRVAFGPITVEGLARGKWRYLSKREVAALKQRVGLS